MWKQVHKEWWLTITDAISSALIKQNRLKCRSQTGLIHGPRINPWNSLKCIVADGGKMTVCLFVCSLPSRQIYLVGRHLSEGLVSDLQWLLTQLCFTKSQTMSGDNLCWWLYWNNIVIYWHWEKSKTKLLSIQDEVINTLTSINHSKVSFLFDSDSIWFKSIREMPYFVYASTAGDK